MRSFAQQRIPPHAAASEAACGYPPALFAELGLMGLTAPEDVGGGGAVMAETAERVIYAPAGFALRYTAAKSC